MFALRNSFAFLVGVVLPLAVMVML